MTTLIIVLIVIACAILALFVLIQNSKGGGLASNFASQNQIMGVKRTTETLEKGTWGLAALIMVLCLVFAFMTHNEFKQSSPRYQTEQMAE
ncbi:preprotein translocase subunit SecG [Bacteroidales bacterium OttesenSCG-928-C03]|nr:preprotein translocase subunit SecG [Bacteroidales bacterium OttesenSCG-928-E04]MDL2308607.1 preprotein translocase subunit SecG [Bacteroidales bacterium OttesenSCG-928-C03]